MTCPCQLLMSELHNTVILTGTHLYFWTNFASAPLSEKETHFSPCWCACGVLTMPFLPSTSWWCLQKGPKEVKSHLHEAPMGTAHHSTPLGKNKFMTFLCITSQKQRGVNTKFSSRGDVAFFYSPQDAEERHNISFSLRLLYYCSRFLRQKYIHMCTDSKPCCSCC